METNDKTHPTHIQDTPALVHDTRSISVPWPARRRSARHLTWVDSTQILATGLLPTLQAERDPLHVACSRPLRPSPPNELQLPCGLHGHSHPVPALSPGWG